MATVLLQAAGSYLGSFFGAVGSTIGAAAGAYGGYLIDQSLINSTRRIQGQRLSSPQSLTGEDGAPLSRVYGTVRQGGTLIWATRFEEASKTERQGSKGGGPKATTYTYYANFAVAICEGEIAHVRRIWADGKELDQSDNTVRIYTGSDNQMPDPLLEAKQGAGNTPAYRGTAYAVFDRLALSNFGNRIPQMQFEVIRPVGGIASDIQAITIIPGSTEFGLSPLAVSQTIQPGETRFANRHVLNAGSDWASSIDELQALCPNLKRVALVVSWFGNDLRAGHCQITPRVSTQSGYLNDTWKVAGQTRAMAQVVSQFNGSAAFGGTPDDASVVAAIQDLKARGLKVTLYPFVLMDIPGNNTLPSPYGQTSQPAYPWRGDLTCFPAPGISGSVDGMASASAQVANFAGAASTASFSVVDNTIVYNGGADWGYRRFILHYAKLAMLAGGVDSFLIGSEFKALTRVRGPSDFPFVTALSTLASDVRQMIGPTTQLTYAADWSEYGAYTPPNTNNLYFHLDPLWANPAINAIGIDNYMPLSDWRDQDWDGNNPDGAATASDLAALKNGVNSGEGYDWYYANTADRQARVRSPIQDGLANKHWVYRFKDLQSWWANAHYERTNGVESLTPTAWVAQSKPIWFTELGCPAVDKAANQPNVFPDTKSSAAALPYFSNAGRDDEAQTRFLTAHYEHWAQPINNPISTQYGGRMLDVESIYIWAWDARPFPAFPLDNATWTDGNSWLTGHWLNGRLSNIALQDLVSALLQEHGVLDFDVSKVDGVLAGYLLERPGTVREALDSLLTLYRVDTSEQAGVLTMTSRDRALPKASHVSRLALDGDNPAVIENIEAQSEAAGEITLEYFDSLRDHQKASVTSRVAYGSNSKETIGYPAVLDSGEALAQLRQFHRQQSIARKTAVFSTGWADIALEVGDRVQIDDFGASYRITKITDADLRQYEAEYVFPLSQTVRRSSLATQNTSPQSLNGAPLCVFLDLPLLPSGSTYVGGLRLATWSRPWGTTVALASPANESFEPKLTLLEPAFMGTIATPLPAGNAGRFETDVWCEVDMIQGGLASQTDLFLFNGANSVAVQCSNGAWEILQFGKATEISAGRWRLQRLLRGQLGTMDAMAIGAPIGARFVVLDGGVKPCELSELEANSALNWRVGPLNKAVSDQFFARQTVAPAARSKKANAPVHLRVKKHENGNLEFSWKRCGTVNADSWEDADIPLPEITEVYDIQVRSPDLAQKRIVSVNTGQWTYNAAEQLTDFGVGPFAGQIEVSQISANGLPGLAQTLNFSN